MQERYDVITVGGGIAGICAAVAAKRMGASVLLIERDMSLGGVLTTSLVNPMMTFHSPRRQVSAGIGQEIVERLIKINGSYGHIKDPIGFVETITPFDPDKLRTVLVHLLMEEGVDYILGGLVNRIRQDQGTICEIEMITPTVKNWFQASTFIDATGNGSLCIRAGAPYIEGDGFRQTAQPMSQILELGGINREKIIDYIQLHPDEFVLAEEPKFDYLAVAGFFGKMKKLNSYGINFQRDRLLFFEVPFSRDRIIMNTSRYNGYGEDPAEITRAQSAGNLDIWTFLEFLRNEIPGFEEVTLIQQGYRIGVRETTHVSGDYIIKLDDLLERRHFKDSIAVGAYPVDIHIPDSKALKTIRIPYPGEYEIPLSSLFPRRLKNVLLCGRAVSANHLAFSAVRTSPLATSTGTAAGICAAMASQKGVAVRDVEPKAIQGEILKGGGIL
ncbi:MAG TPA: FAD-dependent oxidoreductase [Thermotogota bacterium]|nr:FAD-dependent oxidoreductase [Thermotogota bacterium]